MSEIKVEEGRVANRKTDGPELRFRVTSPESPTIGLALVHGYADHSARYAHVARHFAERGVLTVAIDLRGHGESAGHRGFCERFEEFLDDADELFAILDERAKGLPCFVMGHSFGGLVVSRSVVLRPRPWKGLVLSAPFFGLKLEVPGIKVLAGKVASVVYPRLGLPSGLAGRDMCHDEARAKAYDADPLVFKNATARWFVTTTEAQAAAIAEASKVTLPLRLSFGDSDPVASPLAGKRFFDGAGSKDKTWDEHKGLYHEILNEPVWETIATGMADWMRDHAS